MVSLLLPLLPLSLLTFLFNLVLFDVRVLLRECTILTVLSLPSPFHQLSLSAPSFSVLPQSFSLSLSLCVCVLPFSRVQGSDWLWQRQEAQCSSPGCCHRPPGTIPGLPRLHRDSRGKAHTRICTDTYTHTPFHKPLNAATSPPSHALFLSHTLFCYLTPFLCQCLLFLLLKGRSGSLGLSC